MAGKHIPQRTCISCRTVRGKREFVRIVRVTDQHVEPDATGKKSGRGAYLCRQRECWDEALSEPRRLAHALKMEKSILEEDLVHLREVGVHFPPRPTPPSENNVANGIAIMAKSSGNAPSPTTATVETKK